ncbi:unnamed protein product [Ambrosiozyma monospora]|uniref:Unnamed protein product n=1 Tax=Ambrosiozyma monospora TaxID=43982 RepID=A0ACB5SWW9_AMBMO|nr:unnamed protein product [Ambrosiozyma monospora]
MNLLVYVSALSSSLKKLDIVLEHLKYHDFESGKIEVSSFWQNAILPFENLDELSILTKASTIDLVVNEYPSHLAFLEIIFGNSYDCGKGRIILRNFSKPSRVFRLDGKGDITVKYEESQRIMLISSDDDNDDNDDNSPFDGQVLECIKDMQIMICGFWTIYDFTSELGADYQELVES